MDALWDVDATPDTCYLGLLLDGEQRYAIKLDRIHTFDVPVGEKRKEWIEKHRVFQLDIDFIRHLQVRLFSSVAKQGFDDFTWWPRQDLESLVVVGKKNIAEIEAAHTQAVLDVKKAGQEGAKEQKLQGLNNAVDKRGAELDEARSQLAAYEVELERRKSG